MCLKKWKVINNLVAQPSLKMSTGYPSKCIFLSNYGSQTPGTIKRRLEGLSI